MPYRVDISCPTPDALDRLVELGALDVESVGEDLAAILPDSITPETLARAFGSSCIKISEAVGRDSESVWLLSERPVRVGSIVVAMAGAPAPADALRLSDSGAFGTGHHPTTALCLEALEETLAVEPAETVLDVGTGSGILAIAALRMGIARAVGLDIDPSALTVAAENARLNGVADRLQLVAGGPESLRGQWPLVIANVLAAPLIEMAPALVQRLSSHGRLILSGIPCSVEAEVRQAYQDLGLRSFVSETRLGWVALSGRTSW